MTRRRRQVAGILGAGFLLAVILSIVAVVFVPSVQVRAKLLALYVTGDLYDVNAADFIRIVSPGRGYALEALLERRNPYSSIRNALRSAADVEAGAIHYQQTCSVCHGDDGAGGGAGPTLRNTTLYSDWWLYRAITRGIPGTEMAGQNLSDEEAWQTVAYLRSIQQHTNEPAPDDSITTDFSVDPVTYERLLETRDESGNWLTYSGHYDGWRYSPLTQINTDNAHNLQLKWMLQTTSGDGYFEVTPLVNGDTMFITEPPEYVRALDTATGTVLWSYRRPVPDPLPLCCGRVNRGVAALGERVFFGTLDSHLIALDASTGREIWDVQVADYRDGVTITTAPLAVKGLVIIGVSGGEYGIRGHLDAYDAQTGERVWRFYSVPGPGEAGNETWKADSWQVGGGGTWLTGSFDPQLNLLYWGVGNPGPDYHGDFREGDNLYTASVVALDVDTGELQWHYQFTPHDLRDWASNQIPVLVDLTWQGEIRPLMLFANRNGFYYVLDRSTGEYLHARAFVRQNWATGIDDGGRPIIDPATVPTPEGTVSWPSPHGGTNWQSPTYSPDTNLMYVPIVEGARIIFKQADKPQHEPGKPFWGGTHHMISEDDPLFTGIRALNPTTGELVWEHRNTARTIWWKTGGLISTAGGIIFTGDLRDLYVVDAQDGTELWRLPVGGYVNSVPITYTVDSKQRFTMAAGRSLLTFGLPEDGIDRLQDVKQRPAAALEAPVGGKN